MTMPRPESKTLGSLYDRFIGDDPERVASYENARANAEVAGAIYRLRTEAGLSQRELAVRVGTTASVICRLEDADYEGHSLSMLRRIAAALGRRVEISFPPASVKADEPMTQTRRAALSTSGGIGPEFSSAEAEGPTPAAERPARRSSSKARGPKASTKKSGR
jgi:transcriptional regulator with XRE-family HTH domain